MTVYDYRSTLFTLTSHIEIITQRRFLKSAFSIYTLYLFIIPLYPLFSMKIKRHKCPIQSVFVAIKTHGVNTPNGRHPHSCGATSKWQTGIRDIHKQFTRVMLCVVTLYTSHIRRRSVVPYKPKSIMKTLALKWRHVWSLNKTQLLLAFAPLMFSISRTSSIQKTSSKINARTTFVIGERAFLESQSVLWHCQNT